MILSHRQVIDQIAKPLLAALREDTITAQIEANQTGNTIVIYEGMIDVVVEPEEAFQ